MHGHHGHGHHYGHGWKWAAGRHGGGRFGFGRRGNWDFGGRDPEDWMRARRMLAQGDLRLVALALIAEAPRHGYEIIKLLEEKTADWYSPSPGIVYPTLTFLEEAGYVTASTEGSKKLYTITEEGSAYLKANRRDRRRRPRSDQRARRTREPLAAPYARRPRGPRLPAAADRGRPRPSARNHRQASRRRRRCRGASGGNPRPRCRRHAAEVTAPQSRPARARRRASRRAASRRA